MKLNKKDELLFYLYFLDKNNFSKDEFLNEFFHFVRFLNVNNLNKFYKIFYFKNFKVIDIEFDFVINNLLYNSFIKNNKITAKGLKELSCFVDRNDIKNRIKIFEDSYKYESFVENSCFRENDYFNINCSVCVNKICLSEDNKRKVSFFEKINIINNHNKSWKF